jgi:cell division protein FtsW
MTERLWEQRLLIVVTALLVVFGIASVAGAAGVGPSFALRQAIGAAIGALAFLAAARVRQKTWLLLAYPMLGFVVVLLILLILPFTHGIAPVINGARRWIILGWVTVQPGELAKFAVVIWAASFAARKGDQLRDLKRGMLPFIIVMVPVLALVSAEPHLSMTVVIGALAAIVLFAAGAKLGHLVLLAAVGALATYQSILAEGYRVIRLLSFLRPEEVSADASEQIRQSLVGLGAGRLFGVGFGQGQQKLGYLPYSYSDFIFSSIGEEWGFVGLTVLVALFAAYVWAAFRIARTAVDPFSRYLATGLGAMVGITAVLHMAVNLALLPTTGLTLPFIAYGRSSLFVTLAATGVLFSIARARP